MIGWKVDVGYSLSGDIITSLGDIIFTDLNRPYVLTGILPFETITVRDKTISGATELGNLVSSQIGDDYYYFYGFPTRRTIPAGIDFVRAVSLSSLLGYPNLISSLEPVSTGDISIFIYFKSLNKIFSYSTVAQGGAATYRVYSISNGTLMLIYNSRDGGLFNYMRGDPNGKYTVRMYNISNYDESKKMSEQIYTLVKIQSTTAGQDCEYGSTNISEGFINAIFGDSLPDFNYPPPDNPYEPGGPSGPTDPDLPPGTFDDESDPIPDSPLPSLSAANTGFTRIYNPTLSQVQTLARYLWTDESVIQTIWNHIKQFFENPMEAIIGFNLVPVPVPDGGTENFALMYIDTGVSMTVAANQFVDLDCGTVELKRYYGSALDQSPYTKVSCFLPYIGTVNLNTDEVMGTTLQVKYRVDIVSGSCVAKIFVDGNCLYQYSGHCAITIPISSADFSSYVSAAISVGKLAAAAITAGAGAAMAAGVAEASQQTNQVVTTTQVTNTARNPSTGRQITTGTTTTVQTRESPADQSSTQASFSGLSPQNVANTVGTIMSSKPHIEHSGSFSGNSGYLGVRRPFLIIERPNMCMPANYQALNGFPAMITMELSTCKGFTRVQQVQLTGMGRATNPEQAEILELLKSGVIL